MERKKALQIGKPEEEKCGRQGM